MFPSTLSNSFRTGTLAVLSASFLLCASTVNAAKISLRNGDLNSITNELYSGASDNLLASHPNQRNTNFGRTNLNITSANAHAKGAILRFDLSSLRGEVKDIKSVTLTLKPHSVAPESFPFSVYQVRPENAGWKEGTGMGPGNNPAKVGESTSAFKAKGSGNASTNKLWHSGSNFGNGDCFPAAIAKGTFPAGATDSITITLPAEMVQEWINKPAENAGIYITSDVQVNGNYGFIQSTPTGSSPLSDRPVLTIDYTR